MIKEYFKSWNRFEITLVQVSIILIILFGVIFKSGIITITYSIASIITAILQAKGKIESQFVGIIVCLFYSYISYKNKYYGEDIFYILIMLPMSIGGIISWITHKNEDTDTVEVNEIKLKEWILLAIISIASLVGLYNLLKYSNTSELLVSTISMIVSGFAIYLLVRRSKYGFIFY